MAVTNGWGQGVINNSIEWGKGSTNATNGWGEIYEDSPSGDTAIEGASFTNVYSLDFDGVDDYVDCGDLSAYDNGDFSCSLWIYKTTSNDVEYIMANSGSVGRAGFDIVMDASENITVLRNTRTADTISGFTAIGFTINTWHHVIVTYKDATKTLKIYLDGVLKDTTIGITSTNSASIDFMIGSYNGSALFFTGNIDEVAIFNAELSSSDVTDIYNGGTPQSLDSYSSLISWWRFEEGSGTTATDSGSGGNNGTITNGATYSTDKP